MCLPLSEEVEPEQIESLFWYFQLRLAEALGYRPELSGCVSCNAALSDCEAPYFSAGLGGGLCGDCHRAEAVPEDDGYLAGGAIDGDTHETARGRYSRSGGHRVAGNSLGFLARLQNIRMYRKESDSAGASRMRGDTRDARRFSRIPRGRGRPPEGPRILALRNRQVWNR